MRLWRIFCFVLSLDVYGHRHHHSYPLDTIRRRMMMTSGTGTHYKSSIDCTIQILKGEGVLAFFKGAGANVLRGIAGAGAISGFDVFKRHYEEWKFGDRA